MYKYMHIWAIDTHNHTNGVYKITCNTFSTTTVKSINLYEYIHEPIWTSKCTIAPIYIHRTHTEHRSRHRHKTKLIVGVFIFEKRELKKYMLKDMVQDCIKKSSPILFFCVYGFSKKKKKLSKNTQRSRAVEKNSEGIIEVNGLMFYK